MAANNSPFWMIFYSPCDEGIEPISFQCYTYEKACDIAIGLNKKNNISIPDKYYYFSTRDQCVENIGEEATQEYENLFLSFYGKLPDFYEIDIPYNSFEEYFQAVTQTCWFQDYSVPINYAEVGLECFTPLPITFKC